MKPQLEYEDYIPQFNTIIFILKILDIPIYNISEEEKTQIYPKCEI